MNGNYKFVVTQMQPHFCQMCVPNIPKTIITNIIPNIPKNIPIKLFPNIIRSCTTART